MFTPSSILKSSLLPRLLKKARCKAPHPSYRWVPGAGGTHLRWAPIHPTDGYPADGPFSVPLGDGVSNNDQRRREPPPRSRCHARGELEALGPLSVRAAVGHRARGLLGGGTAWDYFPHDHARSRAYRWGEDGLLGITDRECRLCFALALWNGRDPILKERLFGLAGPEGNHGEDVKECYFYLDSTPTHSYMKALYKYPQAEFPYARLVEENRRRGKQEPEFELSDTGVFDDDRYFDVFAEYAKAAPDDILIRITVANRGREAATLHLLPTLWFRNTWIWGCRHEGCWVKPRIEAVGRRRACRPSTSTFGRHFLVAGPGPDGKAAAAALHRERDEHRAALRRGQLDAVRQGRVPRVRHPRAGRCGESQADRHEGRRALSPGGPGRRRGERAPAARGATTWRRDPDLGDEFDRVFRDRIREADEFYAQRLPQGLADDERRVARQAYAGLLWSKQFYHYVVRDWLDGDPEQPPPPARRATGRNADWPHLYNRDVISMPDKWEYPWYAAWDLAFHMIPFARIDPDFAKEQLVLFLREWYMHPNGQLPAYEFDFGDVNPPVHAWACWRVYKMTGARGDARPRVPVALLPEAAHQLHLVGQPQGPATARTSSPAASSGSTTSACSTAPSRCRRAAVSSRPTAPRGWRSSARRCCRWRWNWPATIPPRRTWPRSSSSTSCAIADAMNTLGRHGPVGRGGRLLLRPAARRRADHPAQGPLAGRPDPAARRRGPGRRTDRATARIQEADGLVPGAPPGPGSAHLVLLPAGERRGPRPAPAGHPVARAAGARAALPARRERIPLALRHPLPFPHPQGPAVRLPRRRRRSTGSTTSRASPPPASSAATPTGAVRSGFRSTTC